MMSLCWPFGALLGYLHFPMPILVEHIGRVFFIRSKSTPLFLLISDERRVSICLICDSNLNVREEREQKVIRTR